MHCEFLQKYDKKRSTFGDIFKTNTVSEKGNLLLGQSEGLSGVTTDSTQSSCVLLGFQCAELGYLQDVQDYMGEGFGV